MDQKAKQIIREARAAGRQAYAEWDPRLFHRFCEGPAAVLWESLAGQNKPDYITLENYLRLVQEGIGSGLARFLVADSTANETTSGNLLEICLSRWVPELLPNVKRQKRTEVMTTAWNLCEGLLREPEWVNAYVVTRADEMTDIAKLERFLVTVLDPVVTASSVAAWNGGFETTVLDPLEHDNDFLPGTFTPVAARVVAVRDRRSDTQLGVLLQSNGKSRFLGPVTETPAYTDPKGAPAVMPLANAISIGSTSVELPFLGMPLEVQTMASGYVLVTAADSQRVWVVESQQ